MFHVLSRTLVNRQLEVFPDRGASPLLWLIAVPCLTVGLASDGIAAVLGLAIGLTWFALLPAALYRGRRFALLLPSGAALFFLASLIVLPFNSAAFVVYTWGTLAMFLMTLPKARPFWAQPRVDDAVVPGHPVVA